MTAAELYERSKYFFPPPPQPCYSIDLIDQIPDCCGVYFIWESGSVVYVGESIELRSRLRSHDHAAAGRLISFIQCDRSQRRRLEAFYIGVLDPSLNSQSSCKCPVKFTSQTARYGNIAKKLYQYITSNEGCSLSQIYRTLGRNTKVAAVRRVIVRMEEWGFVREVLVKTAGRTKRVYYSNIGTTL